TRNDAASGCIVGGLSLPPHRFGPGRDMAGFCDNLHHEMRYGFLELVGSRAQEALPSKLGVLLQLYPLTRQTLNRQGVLLEYLDGPCHGPDFVASRRIRNDRRQSRSRQVTHCRSKTTQWAANCADQQDANAEPDHESCTQTREVHSGSAIECACLCGGP